MRWGTKYLAAWLTATAVSVGLSYAGVRDVLRGAVSEPRHARSTLGLGTSTAHSAAPSARPRSAPPHPTRQPSPAPAPEPGDIRSHSVKGGHVAFELRSDSARLLSAAPEAGYEVRTWRRDGWIRVDFSRDGHGGALFVTWAGHPPVVRLYEF